MAIHAVYSTRSVFPSLSYYMQSVIVITRANLCINHLQGRTSQETVFQHGYSSSMTGYISVIIPKEEAHVRLMQIQALCLLPGPPFTNMD